MEFDWNYYSGMPQIILINKIGQALFFLLFCVLLSFICCTCLFACSKVTGDFLDKI